MDSELAQLIQPIIDADDPVHGDPADFEQIPGQLVIQTVDEQGVFRAVEESSGGLI